MKLHSFPGDYRANKALVAAAYNGVSIESVSVNLQKGEHKALSASQKVPVLETASGSLFESNAIAKYVARLRGDTNLVGTCFYSQASVDQWVDFCANELEMPRAMWLYPVEGVMAFNEQAYAQAKADVSKAMAILNSHLLSNTFMVGNAVTLADIALVCTLAGLFEKVFEPIYVADYPNVARWFETCVNQAAFVSVLGTVSRCKKEAKAPKGSGGGKAKKEKKQKNKGEQKQGDNKQSKKEKKKKGKDKKAAAAAPAAAAGGGTGSVEAYKEEEDEDVATYLRFLAANKDEWSGDEDAGEEKKSGGCTGGESFQDEEDADVATYMRFLAANQDEWSDDDEAAAAPAAAKGGKPTKVQGAILTLEISPDGGDCDMGVVEGLIRKLNLKGIDWHSAKQIPFVYGMMKLQIVCEARRDLQVDNLALTTAIKALPGVAEVDVINEEQCKVAVKPAAAAPEAKKSKSKKKKSKKGKKAAAKADGKPKKVKYALVHVELMPDGSETDWVKVEAEVGKIMYDGIEKWGKGVEHDLAFGLMKLRISAQVVRGTPTEEITKRLEAMPDISDVAIIGVEEI